MAAKAASLDPPVRGTPGLKPAALAVSTGHTEGKHAMEHGVNVRVELSAEQAWAVAQLVKGIGWSDCRSLAEDDEQTNLMIQATERLRRALAEAGHAPG